PARGASCWNRWTASDDGAVVGTVHGAAGMRVSGVDSILTLAQREALAAWRASGERIVFTNGVFDLLHRGHVEYLEEARGLGDRLVVGVNSDASVRRLKGPARPLIPQEERAELLEALEAVDLVAIFDGDTPLELIKEVEPDVLAKGGDWAPDQIV